MNVLKNSSIIRSPKLKGTIIENILLLLSQKELSISELSIQIQGKIRISDKVFKKYLIYLVDYELITYNGQRRVYLIEDGGLELLDKINKEKNDGMIDSEDIIIIITI
jgi:predicted transcriptional regulator